MKSFFLTFIISVILISVGCNGQPKSNYVAEWNKVPGVNYKVFLWEGTNPAQCPFQEDQDYLNPDISSYATGTVSDTSFTFNLNNDGKYIVAAVISMDSQGFYSGLAKSEAYLKGTVPIKPGFITLRKK